MIKAGIIGGAGYTAGELIRILLNHPDVSLDFIYSTSNAGNEIQEVHRDLLGDTNLKFDHKINPEVDVLSFVWGMVIRSDFYQNIPFPKTPGSLI